MIISETRTPRFRPPSTKQSPAVPGRQRPLLSVKNAHLSQPSGEPKIFSGVNPGWILLPAFRISPADAQRGSHVRPADGHDACALRLQVKVDVIRRVALQHAPDAVIPGSLQRSGHRVAQHQPDLPRREFPEKSAALGKASRERYPACRLTDEVRASRDFSFLYVDGIARGQRADVSAIPGGIILTGIISPGELISRARAGP